MASRSETDDQWTYLFRRTPSTGVAIDEVREFSLSDVPSLDITGGAGADIFIGLDQVDIINGEAGDDIIYGCNG